MDVDIKTWLYDILQSIKEIESYYDGKPKMYEEYLADIRTKRAIEGIWKLLGKQLVES